MSHLQALAPLLQQAEQKLLLAAHIQECVIKTVEKRDPQSANKLEAELNFLKRTAREARETAGKLRHELTLPPMLSLGTPGRHPSTRASGPAVPAHG